MSSLLVLLVCISSESLMFGGVEHVTDICFNAASSIFVCL